MANERPEKFFRSHCMKAEENRRSPVSMIHRNDGANSEAEICGIVEKMDWPRAGKSLSATIQMETNKGPLPRPENFSPDCLHKENLGPSLNILSTRYEEAIVSQEV